MQQIEMSGKTTIQKIDIQDQNGLSLDSFNVQIAKRIRISCDLIGGGDAMAAKTGIARRTLGNYLSGRNEPKTSALISIARASGKSIEWLATGDQPGHEDLNEAQADDTVTRKNLAEFAYIPLYDVEVSAGHGSVPAGEELKGQIAFRRDWLRRYELRENHLVTVTACGDSMEPTIRDGDLLLVNTQAKEVGKDAIYVIRRDDHVFTKRLQRMLSGDLYIRSDNQAYLTETVKADSGHDLQIIGRVVWIGHEL